LVRIVWLCGRHPLAIVLCESIKYGLITASRLTPGKWLSKLSQGPSNPLGEQAFMHAH
jgi:hypothetical protein